METTLFDVLSPSESPPRPLSLVQAQVLKPCSSKLQRDKPSSPACLFTLVFLPLLACSPPQGDSACPAPTATPPPPPCGAGTPRVSPSAMPVAST